MMRKGLLPVSIVVLYLLSACQESKMERFERETKDFTERNCQKKCDAITVLDSLVFHDDGTMDYKYYYSVELTSEEESLFMGQLEKLRAECLDGIRNSVELKNVKAAGLNIVLSYHEKGSQKKLAEFRYGKEDYQ
ncbi:MAG: hypothetical protein NC206_08210 [Bacteroides sp.]|nr:hypothetical protein [Roseburia sp.]MCM1347052.1 hypothetical protein [Bacteroides sp.]MCM1421734.1 hypothetical protein [Bacteroides sp.]